MEEQDKLIIQARSKLANMRSIEEDRKRIRETLERMNQRAEEIEMARPEERNLAEEILK